MSPRKGAQAPPIPYPKGQQDALTFVPHCPTCGRPWTAPKRVCRKCGQPIARHDKWQTIPAGPGLFALEHRDCENPTAYPGGKASVYEEARQHHESPAAGGQSSLESGACDAGGLPPPGAPPEGAGTS